MRGHLGAMLVAVGCGAIMGILLCIAYVLLRTAFA